MLQSLAAGKYLQHCGVATPWQKLPLLLDRYMQRQERQGMGEKKGKEMWKWAKRLRFIKIRVQQILVGCEQEEITLPRSCLA